MAKEFPRIARLPPYVFNQVNELKLAARRRGEDIVDFGMGNPDQPTPKHIVDKLVEVAQRDGTHRYSVSRGIPRLRRAISRWYGNRYDVDIDSEEEAIVTIGSKEGLAHLALATLDRGDGVLVPTPAYPIHPYGFVIAGADIRHVPMGPDIDFFAELETAIRNSWPKPKMLLLNFPSNPTTQCVEIDFFEHIINIAREHDIYVVNDIAYADLVFDGYTAPSIMQVPGAKELAVEFFSLSKSYNMPGWRIGFMVGNRELVHALARLKSYMDYGTFTPIQVAGIAALEGPQDCVREIRDLYQTRRNVLCDGLNAAGWQVDRPRATMFVWARLPEKFRAMGSLEFTKMLVREAK
ncbi:MAG: alanine transaminase, partial [Gammaproteobacteria bacterium]